MIEAVLQRKYPQIEVTRTLTLREYEQAESLSEDFVISTARISEKAKPVVMIAPFPTDYQLEQIGKLVLVDRTRPWMLDKYFDAAHFRIIDKPIDQQTLFRELCGQLESEGFVGAEFLDSWSSVRRSSAPCSAKALRCRTPGPAGAENRGLYGAGPARHPVGR
jgi:hypothetical protein